MGFWIFGILAILMMVSTGMVSSMTAGTSSSANTTTEPTAMIMMMPVALAQEIPITVQTNDKYYTEGDTIVISGTVTTVLVNTPVLVQIFDENNSLTYVEQLEISQDKRYSHHILAEGPRWSKSGDYTIKISYGIGNIADTRFSYAPRSSPITTEHIYEVDAGPNHGTFDVKYNIRGGIVQEMVVDQTIFGMIVRINATDDGHIRLDLDRDYIGAEKQDGKDEGFIVLVDERWVKHEEEIIHSDVRTITIEFDEGDAEITIIGTYVVPEFGTAVTIAVIISAAMLAIVTLMAATSDGSGTTRKLLIIKQKDSLVPK